MTTASQDRLEVDQEVNAETPVDQLASVIQAIDRLPDDWAEWQNTHEAELLLLDRVAGREHKYPGGFEGRGIVIGAGGATFFACAFCCVLELRRLGCNLPVELWHLGEGEFDAAMYHAASQLPNVRVVDASDVAARLPVPPRRLNGWELKPFSVINSAFEQVLYLDADVIPAADPTYIFETEPFEQFGSIFWPDLKPSRRKEWLPAQCWHNVGLDYRSEPDFESGQFVVDKRRCWQELAVTMHMNEHSDWYYRFVFGDKSTYHLAWRKTGREYGIPPIPCGWKWPCILQYDHAGQLFTQHACQGKHKIIAGEPLQCLTEPDAPVRAAEELRKHWNGRIYGYAASSQAEQLAAEAVEGLYIYDRGQEGSRQLRLDHRGAISEGSAGCEKRWSLQIEDGQPVLTIVGEAHKGQDVGMMRLRQADGVWRGRWLWHNRGEVTLTPYGPADLTRPAFWQHRPETWDLAIFDSVVTENEYKLPARLRPGVTVLDIGAHIGSFSFAALRRGAAAVVAYEANGSNFELLAQNLHCLGQRGEAHNAAIWRPGVERLTFKPSANAVNTGGGGCACPPDELAASVQAVALDEAIVDAARPFGRVSIMKLDCEGAEFPALLSSTRLDLVDHIVGEWHEFTPAATDPAFLSDYPAGFKIEDLQAFLEAAGFRVVLERDTDTLGHFWAGRPSVSLNY